MFKDVSGRPKPQGGAPAASSSSSSCSLSSRPPQKPACMGDSYVTPVYMCKDLESGVPSVPSVPGVAEPPSAAGEHLPYLTPGGTLVIPSDSPERYHWWKPPHDQRLRVKQTLAEVKERMKHAVTV